METTVTPPSTFEVRMQAVRAGWNNSGANK